jgi:hypothetical protein
MKQAVLAVFTLGAMLATACYAQAEPAPVYAGPPGGYVAGPAPSGYGAPPVVQVNAPARAEVGPLRAAVIARFDHNGDGRLDLQERRQALRALRRITRQMAREERRERRAERRSERQAPPQPRVDVDIGF